MVMAGKIKRGELVYDCPLCGAELSSPVVCDTEYGEQTELYCSSCLSKYEAAIAEDEAFANSSRNI
jgi:transcription elongation factor Elf1